MINTKIRYGLRTMLEIGCPDNKDGILQKDIAKNQDLSEKYLDPIISALKTSGLIVNYGGKKSGYILRKPANEITVLDIFRSFESGPTLVQCICNPNMCYKVDKCVAREYWSGLNNLIIDYFNNSTLDVLVKRCRELKASPEELIPGLKQKKKAKAPDKKKK
jgi:Rrf2 family protein